MQVKNNSFSLHYFILMDNVLFKYASQLALLSLMMHHIHTYENISLFEI